MDLDERPAKAARRSDDERVVIDVSDDYGNSCIVHLHRSSAEKIPYLEAMLTTAVGAQDVRKRVCLPANCTTRAFDALCMHFELDRPLQAPTWKVPDCQAGVELLCTADFLLLKTLLPALVQLCKERVTGKADAATLLDAVCTLDAEDSISSLITELRGGLLVNGMSLGEVTGLISSVAKHDKIMTSQSTVLDRWLRQAGRELVDFQALAKVLTVDIWFLPQAAVPQRVPQRGGSFQRYQRSLKPGAAELLAKLMALAVDRPALAGTLPISILDNIPDKPTGGGEYDVAGMETLVSEIGAKLTQLDDTNSPAVMHRLCNEPFKASAAKCLAPLLAIASEAQSQSQVLNHLFRCPQWWAQLSVSILDGLHATPRMMAIKALLPLIGASYAGVSNDVAAHIDTLIVNGEV